MRRAVVIAALTAFATLGVSTAAGLPKASAEDRPAHHEAGSIISQSDEETLEGWLEFGQELAETRRAIRLADAALQAGSWRQDECRFQSLRPGTWTALEEQLTAECAVRKWPVDGGYTRFYSVGDCESGWNRLASNAGRYLGLFQHSARYWSDRVSAFNPDTWEAPLRDRWTNSRSAVVVTARMVHREGWDAWSCA